MQEAPSIQITTIAMLASLDHFRRFDVSEYVRFSVASARLLIAARAGGQFGCRLVATMQTELQ